METLTEPRITLSCSEIIELTQAWKEYCVMINAGPSAYNRYQYEENKATVKLASYNRKTLSN